MRLPSAYGMLATTWSVTAMMSSNTLPPPAWIVRFHHHVTGGGEHLCVPAVGPAMSPVALRAAVNQHDDGILAARVKAIGLDEEAMNVRAIGRIHPEFFDIGRAHV